MRKAHYACLLVSAAVAVAMSAFSVGAQSTKPSTTAPAATKNYIGASKTANIDEALAVAIKQARRNPPAVGADILYHWRIVDIRGSFGGKTGVNTLEVEIEVQGP